MPDVSSPAPDSAPAQEQSLARRLTSPRSVLILLVVTLLLMLLLTPQPTQDRDTSLDSRHASARGAMALHDLAGKLGWPVTRNLLPLRAPLDSTSVYLMLEPEEEVTATTITALLQAVRAGAGLVVTAPDREMSDSLWQQIGARVSYTAGDLTTGHEASASACPQPLQQRGAVFFPGEQVYSYGLEMKPQARPAAEFATIDRRASALRLEREAVAALERGDTAVAEDLRRQAAREPAIGGPREEQVAVAGFRLGKGRVVYVADPDILRNDVLRYCPWGADVLAARMLEWLSDDGRPLLVFDESHRREPPTAWYMALARMLASSSDGRVAVTLALAAVALIVSLGRRSLPPAPARRLERRSPLEHVDALARAYSQAGATRTAARRLVRGLRRRHSSLVKHEDDDEFLRRVAERHPALSDEVEVLRHACSHRIPGSELERVLAAVDSVDATLSGK